MVLWREAALFGLFSLPGGGKFCAMFLLMEKTMQGVRTMLPSAYKRIAPKSMELALLPQAISQAFCGSLVEKHVAQATYFDPSLHWPKPILANWQLGITLTIRLVGRQHTAPKAVQQRP